MKNTELFKSYQFLSPKKKIWLKTTSVTHWQIQSTCSNAFPAPCKQYAPLADPEQLRRAVHSTEQRFLLREKWRIQPEVASSSYPGKRCQLRAHQWMPVVLRIWLCSARILLAQRCFAHSFKNREPLVTFHSDHTICSSESACVLSVDSLQLPSTRVKCSCVEFIGHAKFKQ